MKNFYYLIAFLFVFSSCDELKKLADVEFNSDFEVDIPLTTATLTKSANVDGYTYGGSAYLNLGSDPDLEDYLDLIKSVDLKGYSLIPSGLPDGVVLNTLVISVNDVVFLSATNVDKNSVYSLADVNDAAIDELTSGLENDQSVLISVGGVSNIPFAFTLSQAFETKIVANPL